MKKKIWKLYQSGSSRIREAKKIRAEKLLKLTKEEKDAFNYFNGTGFYKNYQNPKTPPNRFDNRRSFLLKMENEEVRDKFLESFNKREPIN